MDTQVMRYLTMQKFEWMLGDKGVYLAPASMQPGDENEGVYSVRTLVGALDLPQYEEGLHQAFTNLMNFTRGDTFLSSWYIGHKESQAMWDSYGDKGVLIRSSQYQLWDHLPEPLKQAVEIVAVIYRDEEKAKNFTSPLHIKSEKFMHENELRLIFSLMTYKVKTGYDTEIHEGSEVLNSLRLGSLSRSAFEAREAALDKKGTGLVFNYKLDGLISGVVVHPGASEEFLADIVERCKASGLSCPVTRSSLSPKT